MTLEQFTNFEQIDEIPCWGKSLMRSNNEIIDTLNSLQGDTSNKEEKTDVSDTTCQTGLSEGINVEALLDEYSHVTESLRIAASEDWIKDKDRKEEIVETIKNAIKQ